MIRLPEEATVLVAFLHVALSGKLTCRSCSGIECNDPKDDKECDGSKDEYYCFNRTYSTAGREQDNVMECIEVSVAQNKGYQLGECKDDTDFGGDQHTECLCNHKNCCNWHGGKCNLKCYKCDNEESCKSPEETICSGDKDHERCYSLYSDGKLSKMTCIDKENAGATMAELGKCNRETLVNGKQLMECICNKDFCKGGVGGSLIKLTSWTNVILLIGQVLLSYIL